MTIHKSALLILLVGSAYGLYAQESAEEIISKYISYSGGIKKWKSVKTMVMSGTYNYGGIEFPFTSFSKAPDRYKYIVPFQGKYFAQSFDGESGWRFDGFNKDTAKTILTGKAARSMANESDVELESPFINYRKKGHRVSYEGKDSIEGNPCFKLKLFRNNGDTEIYFFKTANYELMGKRSKSRNTELDNSPVEINYSDYRQVGGIRIPFKSVVKTKDQTILTIAVNKVDLNINIQNSEFKP